MGEWKRYDLVSYVKLWLVDQSLLQLAQWFSCLTVMSMKNVFFFLALEQWFFFYLRDTPNSLPRSSLDGANNHQYRLPPIPILARLEA